jgi:Pregnancy-associated plasma protein-A
VNILAKCNFFTGSFIFKKIAYICILQYVYRFKPEMKIKTLLIPFFGLLIAALAAGTSFAQHTKCGTVVTPQQVAKELAIPDTGQFQVQFAPNRCFGKTLSITAHLIADSLGNYGVSEAAIISSVASLNTYFAPICIEFKVCKFNYIPNYKYNRFLKPADEAELITLYSIPNTINIFYPAIVEVAPGSTVGGYAYFPGGPDFIVISKTQLGVILHEMGHFFGLYHTFENQFGLELANGSNCASAGDLVCDTPGDPGLGNTPAPDCQLSPYIKDTNGEWYVPQIGNVMSYYSDDCSCGFTVQQYNRMAAQYQANRFYLW